MTVVTDGTVQMRGDSGPGVAVQVHADDGRLRLVSGSELVGDWGIDEIGISAVHDGFVIRAEGEEFVLKAVEDAALAEELGVVAAPPRMARKVAALHNPEVNLAEKKEPVTEDRSDLLSIAFAVGGVLVLVGGTFLRAPGVESSEIAGVEYWLAFVLGGVLMVAAAFLMSVGPGWGRIVAVAAIAAVIILFGLAVNNAYTDGGRLAAYAFIAGGLVVAVGALFGAEIPRQQAGRESKDR